MDARGQRRASNGAVKVVTSLYLSTRIVVRDLLLHMPPVQFATLMSLPWQGRPPWLGGGSSHDLLLVCVQSLPHTDHVDHLDHPPSTTDRPREKKKRRGSSRVESLKGDLGRRKATSGRKKSAGRTGNRGLVTGPYPHEPCLSSHTCQFGCRAPERAGSSF